MTSLDKPGCYVARRTRDEYNILYAAKKKARRIVVTLLYGDLIEFREERGRARFTVPIKNAFRYAVNCATLTVLREKADKAKLKQAAAKQLAAEKKLTRQLKNLKS